MVKRFTLLVLGLAVLACPPTPARGAEITTVMSAADGADPFDFMLYPEYGWHLRQSRITREYIKNDVAGNHLAFARELDASRTTHTLDINLRLGLYKGLEMFFVFPFVVSDITRLTFPSGVDHSNSSVDPAGSPSLFGVDANDGNKGPKRSGFGDMSVGLKYAPFEQWRDEYYPSWVIGFTYTIPTGAVRRFDNAAVGEGIHTLRLETAISRRMAFAEPYFSLFGDLRLPSSSSLFQKYAPTQKRVWPASDVGVALGVEFYPWDDPRDDGKKARYFSIDVGLSAVYRFRGRGYTDLFEAFGRSACTGDPLCTGDKNKGLTQYDRTVNNDPNAEITHMDGITDVGPYGTYSVWAGFNLQPIEYFSLSFRFMYSYESAHYLTYSDVGQDLDGLKDVQWNNLFNDNEYNPVYNSVVDDPGKRFRSEGANIFGIMVMLAGRF